MAIIGVQSHNDMVVVTFSRAGMPIEDLLFVPDTSNVVVTAVEDLLHDGSKVSFTIRMQPESARKLAQLLIQQSGDSYV